MKLTPAIAGAPPPTEDPHAVSPAPREFRYHVILNAGAGSAGSANDLENRIAAGFRSAGLATTAIDADAARALDERIRSAVSGEAEVIVAAGGDGTVTAVAAHLAGTGKLLAVLPLGTANLLARDLAIPLDWEDAIVMLGSMEARAIDVGSLNDRLFLHKVAIGLAPIVAAGRERIRHRRDAAAMFGLARHLFRQLWRHRPMRVTIRLDEGPMETARLRALAVANNAYDEGFGRIFSRARLDGGHLTVYLFERLGICESLRLAFGMLTGSWRQDRSLRERRATRFELHSKRKLLQIMIDGEVEPMKPPLHFHIRPRALQVLAPLAAAVSKE